MRASARVVVLAAIGGIWIASLALPAVHLPSGAAYDGLELLRRAWAAPRAGVFSWYANPLFVCAALLYGFGKLRAAGVVSGLALLLGLTSFAAEPVARASGAAVPPLRFGIGFYLWVTALAGLCAWCWVCVARQRFAASAAGSAAQVRD